MTPVSVVLKRPLVDVYTCCAVLGCTNEHYVIALCDEGKLRWVFNIGRRDSRRCLRIFAPSLADYQAGRKPEEDFNKVIAAILPGHSETISGATLARTLSCTAEHVKRLLMGKEFTGQIVRKAGPNSSPLISRASIVKFLKGRVV